MKYLIQSDDISVLDFTTRTHNCLKRAKIFTINDLLSFPVEEFEKINNMGKTSLNEVMSKINKLYDLNDDDYQLVDRVEAPPPQFSEQEENDNIDNDISILNLSAATINRLKEVGLCQISQLQKVKREELLSIKHMRASAVDQIFACLDEYNEQTLNKLYGQYNSKSDSDNDILNIIEEITEKLGIDEHLCKREVLSVYSEAPELIGEPLIYVIYKSNVIRNRAKFKIVSLIHATPDSLHKEQIAEYLPSHLNNTTIIEELLIELQNDGEITEDDDVLSKKVISCIDFAESLTDERRKRILLDRLSGKTLEEIGQEHGGLSRERIRQLINKALNKKPELYEDQYLYLFDTYDLTVEDFCLATNEPAYVYHYLEMVSHVKPKDKKAANEALTDKLVAVSVRKGIEKSVYKDFITTRGERIPKTRPALVEFYVRTNCKNLTTFDDFADGYRSFLNDFGILTDKYDIEERTYINHLSLCDFTLWNMNRSFRYYNIADTNKEEFIKGINIRQYVNKEISTLKIFRDYPELMKEFDIRDEYELHNYLKKTWDDSDLEIKFGRMPTLAIGQINREEQVFNLLISNSPIENTKLAKAYEEEYGVKAQSVLANYFDSISVYYYNGLYTIPTDSMPHLDEKQYAHLKNILVDDFYMIENIENIFIKEYPFEDRSQINPYTLNMLGFNVYAGYVVKKTQPAAMEYFEKLLTEEDIVDARSWTEKMFLPSFTTVMYKLKTSYEIVEYLPLQFINIRKLNEQGIAKEDLKAYVEDAKKHIYPGQYFTIQSLRKTGFEHQLDDLGFDDWFYASLITEDKESFYSQRVGGTKLFSRTADKIVFMDFIEYIVQTEKKIYFDKLRSMLKDIYGIETDRDKLLYNIKRSALYYDSIMETVYVDYNTYLEDI